MNLGKPASSLLARMLVILSVTAAPLAAATVTLTIPGTVTESIHSSISVGDSCTLSATIDKDTRQCSSTQTNVLGCLQLERIRLDVNGSLFMETSFYSVELHDVAPPSGSVRN